MSISMIESNLVDRELLVTGDMTPEQADEEFRAAMHRLDWGPECKDLWRS